MHVDSSYLVPFEGSFTTAVAPTAPPAGAPNKRACKAALHDHIDQMADLQEALHAENRRALLVVFQAMDAAGKDSTIRAATSGVNPAGFQVFSFKAPSQEELDHDFLWRLQRKVPERGRIGIFNRSHYEEVLVIRVHPEYLGGQRIDVPADLDTLWAQRFDSIRDWEAHLVRNGTSVVKFFLHVSREEQARRFMARLDRPEKNYKFSADDLGHREHWDAYMSAYDAALNATSRPHAPWYAIPADDKPFMRMCVADILVRTLQAMNPRFPELGEAERGRLAAMRAKLEADIG